MSERGFKHTIAIHHIALRTRDVERLVAFYQDTLGLPTVREQPGYSVWLAVGAVVLMIEHAEPDEPPIDPASQELLAFAIEDRNAFLKNLDEHGTPVEASTDCVSRAM